MSAQVECLFVTSHSLPFPNVKVSCNIVRHSSFELGRLDGTNEYRVLLWCARARNCLHCDWTPGRHSGTMPLVFRRSMKGMLIPVPLLFVFVYVYFGFLDIWVFLFYSSTVNKKGLLKLAQVQQIDSEAFIEAVRNEFYLRAGDACYAGDGLNAGTPSPSSSSAAATAATTAISNVASGPIEFFSETADAVRCQRSHALSCNTDAQRLRSVRQCLDALFPQDCLSSLFTPEQYSNLMTQLQQPCFLFFNVVSSCRLSQTGGNIARQWRRAPRPLAIREWPPVARRAPAGACAIASRIPTCPMYTQYVALYTLDYWCIPAGGSEWTRLLRNSPALVSSGARALTGAYIHLHSCTYMLSMHAHAHGHGHGQPTLQAVVE